MPKHTPEPWTNEGRTVFVDWPMDNGETLTTIVADCPMTALQGDEAPANAERIVACVNACAGIADPSAVPLMLEALRDVGAWLGCLDDLTENEQEAIESIAAALAKAEGR